MDSSLLLKVFSAAGTMSEANNARTIESSNGLKLLVSVEKPNAYNEPIEDYLEESSDEPDEDFDEDVAVPSALGKPLILFVFFGQSVVFLFQIYCCSFSFSELCSAGFSPCFCHKLFLLFYLFIFFLAERRLPFIF